MSSKTKAYGLSALIGAVVVLVLVAFFVPGFTQNGVILPFFVGLLVLAGGAFAANWITE